MIVSAILRKSETFDERHVYWLGRQVAEFMPTARFLPFSDVPLDIPHERLPKTLPTWWSKMELTKYETEEPMLVLDLDTVLVKPVTIPTDRPYIARHFIVHNHIMGGMVLWTPEFRRELGQHFFKNPRRWIAEANWDDQLYYWKHHGDRMGRFQDVMPDQIVSYKYTVQFYGLQPENTIVLFHGVPRPWDLSKPWIPKLGA